MNPIKVFHNNSDGSTPSKKNFFFLYRDFFTLNNCGFSAVALHCFWQHFVSIWLQFGLWNNTDVVSETWAKLPPISFRRTCTPWRQSVVTEQEAACDRAARGILGEVELCHFAGLERPIRIGGVSSATAWLAGVRCALIKAAREATCVNSGRRAEVKRQQTRSAKRVKVAAEWEEPDIREVTVLKEPLCRWFIHVSTWVGICSEVQK